MRSGDKGLTQALGSFIARVRYDTIPSELVDLARVALTDHVAAVLAGCNEPVVTLLAKQLHRGRGDTTALFSTARQRGDTRDAALINAASAHCLEYDDVGLLGHPSAVLLGALLAEGFARDANGRRVVAAYATGLEVWARLIAIDADTYHLRGWHTTSIIGALAGAGAVANLAGLDDARAASALALATCFASGTRASFGTMGKPIQVGMAASASLLAARIAEGGGAASRDALEHPAGILSALSGGLKRDARSAVASLGRDWHVLGSGLHFRKYPMCYGAERIIEATLHIKERNGVQPADVGKVEVFTGRNQMRMLRFPVPTSAEQARFSVQFAVACALIHGRVELDAFEEAFVASGPVRMLMARVSVVAHDEVDQDDARFGAFDEVVMHMLDGRALRSPRIARARGHFRRPFALEERWNKLEKCAAFSGQRLESRRLFERLDNIGALESIRLIMADQPVHG